MKKHTAKKSTTVAKKKVDMPVSELAGMIARGFTEVHDEMHDMEERLAGKINMVEKKVDGVRDGLNDLSYETKKSRTRIENLELKVFGTIQEA